MLRGIEFVWSHPRSAISVATYVSTSRLCLASMQRTAVNVSTVIRDYHDAGEKDQSGSTCLYRIELGPDIAEETSFLLATFLAHVSPTYIGHL